MQTGMSGMGVVSIALAGFLGQFVPVYIIFAACGALIALAGVFGFIALPRNVVPIEE